MSKKCSAGRHFESEQFCFKCYFSKVNLFIISYYVLLHSLKNSFGKAVFQILAKIEMTRNINRLFSRHFETSQHFDFFSRNYDFYSRGLYTYYGANVITKFRWERFSSGGGAPTRVKVPWSLKRYGFRA